MPGRWYGVKEAAGLLGVSHDTISRLVDRGELPAIRLSERVVRIPRPAFDAYVAGRRPVARRVVRRQVATGVPFGAGEPAAEPGLE
jgi:excisionase family DNA binding protein